MNSAAAMRAVARSIERSKSLSVTLSRDLDRLHDPVNGDVLLEVSGAHSGAATSLLIQPQTGYSMRGAAEQGASVTVTGHATTYATTAKATVDGTAPDTLSLAITPGLEAGLSGGEAVSIADESTVSYAARKVSGRKAADLGWSVPQGSAVYLIDHEGKRRPSVGDIATGDASGSVLNVDDQWTEYSIVQVGGEQ